MKYSLIAALLILPTLANAQELTIKATPVEADLIWKGLRKLPVEDVETLMAKIRQQVADQTKPIELPKVEEKK